MNSFVEAGLRAAGMILDADDGLRAIALLTLQVSLSAAAIGAVFALPLGALVAVARFPGRRTVIVLLNASMGTPTVVVGLVVYLLLAHVHEGMIVPALFTPRAMILAQALVVTPLMTTLVRQTIEDGWTEYREQLRSLGVSTALATLTILWELRHGLALAVLAGFGKAASEIGAVLIVGGNLAGYTRVMTTTIALETSKGDLALALALGFILVAMIVLVNTVAFSVQTLAQRREG